MNYRPEIDGLRALAVAPVILFHAGMNIFSGGFIGVDIFFVISGYLITSILIEDIENNSFSILNFYERRARRILPALFVMVLFTIIIGWFILTPYFYRDLFQTIFSVSFFASNILLYIKSGYFSAISELKPLLHTWSLAVEEQFYILFPIFLLVIWRFGKKKFFLFLVLISIISLTLSEWAWRIDTSANFYLLPTRIWELTAGSLASLLLKKYRLRENNFISLLGLLAILYSIFYFDENTPFPSIYTLIPITGTVLLILFAKKETIVAKLLKNKILVSIGLISYSAYLWHQPIFSFIRHIKFEELTSVDFILCLIVIFTISYLSWKFVEQPFRNKKKINKLTIWFFSIFVFLLLSSIGYIGHKNMGFPNRLSEDIMIISKGSFDKNPNQKKCHFRDEFNDLSNSCILGADVEPTYALIGDSHGDIFAYELHKKLKNLKLASYNFAFNGCSPVNFEKYSTNYKLNECYQKIYQFLKSKKNIDTLIISFRWTSLITGMGFGNENLGINENIKKLSIKDLNLRGKIISSKITEFSSLGKKIILIYPIPEAGKDVPNYTTKQRMLKDNNFEIQIPYKDFIDRNFYSYKALDEIYNHGKISKIYPSKIFCNKKENELCNTIFEGKSLYFDDDHLSNYGASFIIDSIFNK